MTAAKDDLLPAAAGWRRLGVIVLALAATGLPVNDISVYVLLAIVAVIVFCGEVTAQPRAWLAALAIATVALAGQVWLAPPRIDEGHNVFLPSRPGAPNALERGLPADVYRHLAQEFDKLYPPDKRCDPAVAGCWRRDGKEPDRTFAFSADGIFHRSDMSRAVTELDFSDPVWQRLGFINELAYNWLPLSDVQRATRDRRVWKGFDRWHLTMPWFEMIRLPAAYVGGELCWRGDVMWESAGERFALWRGDGCRAVEPDDAGRRVVGVAIKPESLAMRLEPPASVGMLRLLRTALFVAAICAMVVVLVRFRARATIAPLTLLGLAVAVIAIDDASFLGGVRPFDGGDDGLFYEGVGRLILAKFLAGDIWGALEGGEKVFYYGGPGLRYFRALEHVVFGDSFLGYLTLVLALPFIALALFARFLPKPWPLALTILFIAVPLGALFGTTFIHYAQWAARGFADPAAYIFFIAGTTVLVGARGGPDGRFLPGLFAALLLALAICMKPIVAPAAAVLLGGAGLAALMLRQFPRLAGLCIGFLPVFSMALHNWVYGRVFVLFSTNSQAADLLVVPPSAYLSALRGLFSLDIGGLARILIQWTNWLSGPAESYWTIPLNAAGVAVLVYVVARGRGFDPWLRLVGASALAQHIVALFYNAAIARYHFLTWFLTMLVVMVWLREVGIGWMWARYPLLSRRIAEHPVRLALASGLSRLERVSS